MQNQKPPLLAVVVYFTDASQLGFIVCLISFGLISLETRQDAYVMSQLKAGQSIWNSLKLTLGLGLSAFFLSVLAFALVIPLHLAFAAALAIATWAVMVTGKGRALILYGLVRRELWRAKLAPLNYAHFLDEAVNLVLLRRVGNGYIFLHRYLRDYFDALN